MRARDISARERLLARLVPQSNGCWHWTGVIDKSGYGRIGYKGRRSETIQRAVYDCFIGPIEAGNQIDHLCHTNDPTCGNGTSCLHRRCGNPEHLEQVTQAANNDRSNSWSATNRRKTHCPQGHPYDEHNTYVAKRDSRRYCIECYIARHGKRPVRRSA